MRVRAPALCLVCVVSLCGQRKFSWQDACFKNPRLPYCTGHESAVKKTPKEKDPTKRSIFAPPLPLPPGKAGAAVEIADGMDWRFADPEADALVGFNGRKLAASPLARGLLSRLGTELGLGAPDMQKIFDTLSGVDHVALSIRGSKILVMFSRRAADWTLPALEAGWKSSPVEGNAMLIGPAPEVDQALRRLATGDPPDELWSLATSLQAAGEFWAAGSGALGGQQPAGSVVHRFSLTVSTQDRFTSEAAFSFEVAPDANMLRIWPAALGAVEVDGNLLRVRMSMSPDEAQRDFPQIAASPLGLRLAELVKVARYLPAPAAPAGGRSKPVIYGLDGGAREVGQH